MDLAITNHFNLWLPAALLQASTVTRSLKRGADFSVFNANVISSQVSFISSHLNTNFDTNYCKTASRFALEEAFRCFHHIQDLNDKVLTIQPRIAPTSVSYTHLDVYKRQLPHR